MALPNDDTNAAFHLLYLAWLQCGMDTHPMNEDFERMMRARGQQRPPSTCKHGKTLLTCEKCYLSGNGYGT